MLEKFQSVIKFINKEIVFLIIGVGVGFLTSGVLREYFRNQCIEKIQFSGVLYYESPDYKGYQRPNHNQNIETIEKLCGKV